MAVQGGGGGREREWGHWSLAPSSGRLVNYMALTLSPATISVHCLLYTVQPWPKFTKPVELGWIWPEWMNVTNAALYRSTQCPLFWQVRPVFLIFFRPTNGFFFVYPVQVQIDVEKMSELIWTWAVENTKEKELVFYSDDYGNSLLQPMRHGGHQN